MNIFKDCDFLQLCQNSYEELANGWLFPQSFLVGFDPCPATEALDEISLRLRSGLCEVQNVPTRRVGNPSGIWDDFMVINKDLDGFNWI